MMVDNLESLKDPQPIFTFCVVARICSIALFVIAAAFLIFDVIAKAYPISIGAAGLGLAALAFVGNFIIAPASSLMSFAVYAVSHSVGFNKFNASSLFIGSYLVIVGGLGFASYHIGCFKKGK